VKPAAVIFDFDGVIADTEPLHARAFAQALAGRGITLTRAEYEERFLGLADRQVLAEALRQAGQPADAADIDGLIEAKNAGYMRQLESGFEPLPGVRDFVARAARRRPLAICSGARRVEIDALLAAFDLARHFRAVVSVEDTPVSKPDPSGYRLVVQRLADEHPGLAGPMCLAIEDSRHGIAAARAAGLRVLAVQSTYAAGDLADADAVVPDLTRASDDLIESIFNR
jgi:HAD superfamily hydrolase (TIGR01509 family)